MPRVARKKCEIKFYHVLVQGINREEIFKKPQDKEKYIEFLTKFSEEENIQVLAYCILKEHAHILVYSNKIENLSKMMQRLNVSYSRFYNKKYDREGFVFRNRFSSETVETIERVFDCINFIHNEPVKNEEVIEKKLYKYSSYNKYPNDNLIINECVFNFNEEHEVLDNVFIDVIKTRDIKEKISNFCKEKNISKYDLYNNYEILAELSKKLRDEEALSIRAIAKVLNTNRERIKRLVT